MCAGNPGVTVYHWNDDLAPKWSEVREATGIGEMRAGLPVIHEWKCAHCGSKMKVEREKCSQCGAPPK